MLGAELNSASNEISVCYESGFISGGVYGLSKDCFACDLISYFENEVMLCVVYRDGILFTGVFRNIGLLARGKGISDILKNVNESCNKETLKLELPN